MGRHSIQPDFRKEAGLSYYLEECIARIEEMYRMTKNVILFLVDAFPI